MWMGRPAFGVIAFGYAAQSESVLYSPLSELRAVGGVHCTALSDDGAHPQRGLRSAAIASELLRPPAASWRGLAASASSHSKVQRKAAAEDAKWKKLLRPPPVNLEDLDLKPNQIRSAPPPPPTSGESDGLKQSLTSLTAHQGALPANPPSGQGALHW